MKICRPLAALAATLFMLLPLPAAVAGTNAEVVCARLAAGISRREDLTAVVKRELLAVIKANCEAAFREPAVGAQDP